MEKLKLVSKFVSGLLLGTLLIMMTGCSQKDTELEKKPKIEEIIDELPAWYMQPKDAAGKDYLCEVGSDPTRTGALLEGKENLMALINTEVNYFAETRRNGNDSAWRSRTEFRAEGMLKRTFIHKYKIGPEGNVYILLCINKSDLVWEDR